MHFAMLQIIYMQDKDLHLDYVRAVKSLCHHTLSKNPVESAPLTLFTVARFSLSNADWKPELKSLYTQMWFWNNHTHQPTLKGLLKPQRPEIKAYPRYAMELVDHTIE